MMTMTGLQNLTVRMLLALTLLTLGSCGGGGGGGGTNNVNTQPDTPNSNVQTLVVDAGPDGLMPAPVNLLYTSVRICLPGTDSCQTIDHVMVDTGSTGLRLLSSAVQLPLPASSIQGKPLYSCMQFLDQSYMWGQVVTADLYLGGDRLDGRSALNLPLQLIGSSGAPQVPDSCAPQGFVPKDNVRNMQANGVLGLGYFLQDCAARCTGNADNGYYFLGNRDGTVTGTQVGLSQQLQQPVGMMSGDNNGVIISLPGLAPGGANQARGTLKFGIGTQPNNQPGAINVLTFNEAGFFTTVFNGRTMTRGFIDSGSNGLFFGTGDWPLCSRAPQWYCPEQMVSLQATQRGANGNTHSVSFAVGNAQELLTGSSVAALASLAGPIGDSVSFDFGLPFFFGRDVFVAIEGRSTVRGPGPFVGY